VSLAVSKYRYARNITSSKKMLSIPSANITKYRNRFEAKGLFNVRI